MLEIPVCLKNENDFVRTNEVFTVGVPFPVGCLLDTEHISLQNNDSKESIDASFGITSSWSDGSVQWGLLTFRTSLAPREQKLLTLTKAETLSSSIPKSVIVEELTDKLIVNTGLAEFHLSTQILAPFVTVLNVGKGSESPVVSGSLMSLEDDNGKQHTANITDTTIDQKQSSLFVSVKQQGEFGNSSQHSGFSFISKLTFYQESSVVKWDFTIWNSAAAKHQGGCWDLGDERSLLFKSLSAQLSVENAEELSWKDIIETEWKTDSTGNFSVYQGSSGGDNWESATHQDSQGNLPSLSRGYLCRSKSHDLIEGLRASPFMHLGNHESGVTVHMTDFWQNFPKAMSVDQSKVTLSIFPEQIKDALYELQGGERKTHSIYFDFKGGQESLNWAYKPLVPTLTNKWYEACGVIPFMRAGTSDLPLDELLKSGLHGESNFFQKRELADEFGWRNFGEVFADHETLYQKPNEPLYATHYNNQYDPILGFTLQFIQKGDTRWFELMNDLARHVCDIDIYHTELDKVEYNGGLFWHTDHYLDAHTCTHRTFSKHNATSSTPGQTGGGPGAEHCYSMGLMYHYFMTGNETSKEAVIKLADWMINVHDGADGLLAQVLSIKNVELKKLIALLKGGEASAYRYPLTRGTGNFINTLLDAFIINDDRSKLDRVEGIIRQTLHPLDDIEKRDLKDIENTWSYTVLLQAIAKYLFIKEQVNEIDSAYGFAKQSLMHYVAWMKDNEMPYMEGEAELEFPNDTWVAQEIRKANLLVHAANYLAVVEPERKQYIARAEEFYDYIVDKLTGSKELHFSRVQILLMQNYGVHLMKDVQQDQQNQEPVSNFGFAPKMTILKVISLIVLKVFKGVRHFSPAGERKWLKTRGG